MLLKTDWPKPVSFFVTLHHMHQWNNRTLLIHFSYEMCIANIQNKDVQNYEAIKMLKILHLIQKKSHVSTARILIKTMYIKITQVYFKLNTKLKYYIANA